MPTQFENFSHTSHVSLQLTLTLDRNRNMFKLSDSKQPDISLSLILFLIHTSLNISKKKLFFLHFPPTNAQQHDDESLVVFIC